MNGDASEGLGVFLLIIAFIGAFSVISFVSFSKGHDRAMREGVTKGYTHYIVDSETIGVSLNWKTHEEVCNGD